MQRAFLSPPPSPLDRGDPGGPGGDGGEKNCPPLVLPSSCFIDEHVTRVAWLNRSNILYAGNDRWTSDPRVRLLTNTPEEFSILITQVGLGDEGLYTCSFQTRHQPYTTQVYLIVHGEPSAGALAGKGEPGMGAGERGHSCPRQSQGHPGKTDTLPALTDSSQAEGEKVRDNLQGRRDTRARGHLKENPAFVGSALFLEHLLRAGTAPQARDREEPGRLALPFWRCLSEERQFPRHHV